MANPTVAPDHEAVAPQRAAFNFKAILQQMVQLNASDLHLKVGRPPTLRVNGDLSPLPLPALRPEDLTALAKELMTPKQVKEFSEYREADFATGVPGIGRFRVNAYQQRGTIAFALRTIPHTAKSCGELNLPAVVEEISMRPRGLVLVTGITGSGKSTALASMIQHINERRYANIITIEDPIEFLHRDNRCHINQREVGTDTGSFAQALRRVLRQDPDVILLGEIRDLDTLETALKAADTGHLVFSTLHTLDASETINRIIAVFPPHQQKQIRMQLASVLKAVVSQRLLPKADGKGRAAAVEVMITTPFIRDCIVDKEKTHLIHSSIASGTSQYGMQTFDQAIFGLYEQKQVTYEEALRWASNKDEFKLKVQGISTTSDETRDQMARGAVNPQRPHASPQVTRFGRG